MHRGGLAVVFSLALARRSLTAAMAASSSSSPTTPAGGGGPAVAISHADAARAVASLAPDLTGALHKGQAGRVCVLGGSKLYTGAPYFAASSALRTGSDLAFVLCAEEAATPIKCYSPELMVAPVYVTAALLGERGADVAAEEAAKAGAALRELLPRAHVLVLGPGLGRDAPVLALAAEALSMAASRSMPVVVDADGLVLLCERPELAREAGGRMVLTPNAAEFRRLAQALGTDVGDDMDGLAGEASFEPVRQLSAALGGAVVLRKGRRDVVSDGSVLLVLDVPGAPRRCGGLGDVLSGSVGAFLHWASLSQSPLVGSPLWAALCGAAVTRGAQRRAYAARGRGTSAVDVLDKVVEEVDAAAGEER